MRFARVILALGIAALAPIVGLQSLANANLAIPPAQHWNGFQTAKFALARLEAGEVVDGEVPQFSIREPGPDLARMAFASEPLASDALFVLAVEAQEQRGEEAAREIVQLAGQLEQRNRYVGILRMQNALADENIDDAFAVLDQFALVNPDMAGPLVTAMTPLLAEPVTLSSMAEALSRDPVWAEDFWIFAPRNPETVAGLIELRSRVDTGTSAESDELLMAAAVQQNRHADALAMWDRLAGESASRLAYIPDESYAPIGWDFEKTGRKSVNVTGSGGYRIFVAGNSDGAIGQQLVRLEPGQYVLEIQGDDAVIARLRSALRCANSDANPQWQQGAEETRFTVAAGCTIHWLMLGADTFEQRNPIEGMLSRIDFRRAD
ncbi:hypothetical protein [Aurantiacibacter marinus]|uniref:Uncharacterized protein n=1 Tax=Aurantiacibacter marinus TaxID=874156 RepID=A0A0H0XNV9_9SPHN|nr:hypothetical protein [Aurantiacibacter marinus]KLI63711.1 hypothetical protein AAV99_08250 [Aurantiacibacter marinus]